MSLPTRRAGASLCADLSQKRPQWGKRPGRGLAWRRPTGDSGQASLEVFLALTALTLKGQVERSPGKGWTQRSRPGLTASQETHSWSCHHTAAEYVRAPAALHLAFWLLRCSRHLTAEQSSGDWYRGGCAPGRAEWTGVLRPSPGALHTGGGPQLVGLRPPTREHPPEVAPTL